MASNQNSIKQMSETNNLKRELQRDIQLARKKFEGYDKLYAGLSGDGKKYLQNESKKYKRTVDSPVCSKKLSVMHKLL